MTSYAHFYKRPFGSQRTDLPFAKLTLSKSSRELISSQETDAAFFRGLEGEGLFLNAAQIQAVRHGEGPLLTLAGAGSGKTSVLVSRTGYLISVRQVDPSSILLVTFSTKAAAEMKERIQQLPGIHAREAAKVTARTFHSFFLYLLRSRGYRQDILSNARHQQFIVKRILREMGLQDSYEAETVLALWSAYRMNMTSLDNLPPSTPADVEHRQIFARYEAWKEEHAHMDFDDILVWSHRLLTSDPRLLSSLQQRYRFVMVDEFQDTGRLPYELIQMIVRQHANLMVVGDDDQTIYSFNGARHEFILEFDQNFPRASVITLDVNYRSVSSIVGLGNEIIKDNTKRRLKTLQSTRKSSQVPLYLRPDNPDEEAELLLKHITDSVREGRRLYGDYAILYRTSHNSRAIFEQLVLEETPFIHYEQGDLFYEQWMVKPVMDYLRLSQDRRNFEAMAGILHTLYINREKGMEYIKQQDAPRPKKGPLAHLLTFPGLKDFQVEQIRQRSKLIKSLKPLEPAEAIREIRLRFYDKYMEADGVRDITLHQEFIQEGLDELEASAKRFKDVPSFLAFVDRLITVHAEMALRKKDDQADAIKLMTIHKAKGLEFPSVCLIGASDGILPHTSSLQAENRDDHHPLTSRQEKGSDALEEERRLAYVAVTRAKDELLISSPAYYRGRKMEVSRFLQSVFHIEGLQTMRPIQKSATASTQPQTRSQQQVTEAVKAWVCSGSGCRGWQRMEDAKGGEQPRKTCPLCGSPMKPGMKQAAVPSRRR
ncbi:UvrD-helicase domain-containing protein [Paenibacillus lemnae]|uniref:DNA 3'-5' helicase n=1 Tax=Paenibacillus lemnae TaxID=1330551 RepID=A0A848MA57_PAELE|nr:UvrD-helicase domain-containing protein [Paenibacillus lemnae]NMO96364.1 UvrD-helicase domain-containing protein [Paenibacillus lemnae]